MQRSKLANRNIIITVLILQFIPFVLFPPDAFSLQSQEWWLPVLLGVMVIFADVQLIVRRSDQMWPWNLMSFAQGFNIISRLMMLWPHATKVVGGTTVPNVLYIVLTFLTFALSALLLWYTELPDVRLGLLRE